MVSINRRQLLLGAAATTGLTALSAAGATPAGASGGVDWAAARREFRLDPSWINLSLFYLSSHPRAVREAIATLRDQLDANPLDIDDNLTLPDGPTGWDRTRAALAGYLGGSPQEYALVQNTTVGLGLVYNGIVLRPGQEFLISAQEHNAHQGAAILAAEKHGATVRHIRLFDRPADVSPAEVAERLRQEIRPQTRIVGVTWVQSGTGVRVPVETVAGVVAEANEGRAEADRCLLVVDGVHAIGAIDTGIDTIGADFVVAGAHKWLFGPRGTGLIWSPPAAWPQLRPTVAPVFRTDGIVNMTPGTFQAFEHMFALPAAIQFQQQLGRARVAARIADLSTRVKQGLAAIPGVTVHTPMDPARSGGITAFDLGGMDRDLVTARLREKRIGITTAPYAENYLRIGTAPINTPAEIDQALHELRVLARS